MVTFMNFFFDRIGTKVRIINIDRYELTVDKQSSAQGWKDFCDQDFSSVEIDPVSHVISTLDRILKLTTQPG